MGLMWCVQHWSNEPFSYGEMFFSGKQQAVNFCENIHNGYYRLIQKEWVEKEKVLYEFPLKKGLPIIVNSRYHLSVQTKKFNQMLGK